MAKLDAPPTHPPSHMGGFKVSYHSLTAAIRRLPCSHGGQHAQRFGPLSRFGAGVDNSIVVLHLAHVSAGSTTGRLLKGIMQLWIIGWLII